MITDATSAGSGVNIASLIADTETASTETKKSGKANRKIQAKKVSEANEKNIEAMKDQQKQNSKGGFFAAILSIGSTIMQIASVVLSALFPGTGAMVANIINGVAQGGVDAGQKANPFFGKAQKAEVKALEYKKVADDESLRFQMMDEEVKESNEAAQRSRAALDRALENQMMVSQSLMKL